MINNMKITLKARWCLVIATMLYFVSLAFLVHLASINKWAMTWANGLQIILLAWWLVLPCCGFGFLYRKGFKDHRFIYFLDLMNMSIPASYYVYNAYIRPEAFLLVILVLFPLVQIVVNTVIIACSMMLCRFKSNANNMDQKI